MNTQSYLFTICRNVVSHALSVPQPIYVLSTEVLGQYYAFNALLGRMKHAYPVNSTSFTLGVMDGDYTWNECVLAAETAEKSTEERIVCDAFRDYSQLKEALLQRCDDLRRL